MHRVFFRFCDSRRSLANCLGLSYNGIRRVAVYAIYQVPIIYCAFRLLHWLQPMLPAQSNRMSSMVGKTSIPGVQSQPPNHPRREVVGRRVTWEERWHPLREEWVIIAAHRNSRPWTGDSVNGSRRLPSRLTSPIAICAPAMPASRRAQRRVRRHLRVRQRLAVRVAEHAPREIAPRRAASFATGRRKGKARVVCYSPLHNTTLAELPADEIRALLGMLARSSTASWATGRK